MKIVGNAVNILIAWIFNTFPTKWKLCKMQILAVIKSNLAVTQDAFGIL